MLHDGARCGRVRAGRVSAVDGSRVDALVTGSYDGMLRVWTGVPLVTAGPI